MQFPASFIVTLLQIELLCTSLASSTVEYNYGERGPDTWWFFYPEQCDTFLFPIQSPVELSTNRQEAQNLGNIKFDFWEADLKVRMQNNGAHLVMTTIHDEEGSSAKPEVSGGPLNPDSRYRFSHVLWHWGENDTVGSEHVIDGKRSPLEMQLVFYNVAKYQSLNEALHFEDGIVILAFQYHITDGPQNPAYHFLSEVIPLVQQAGHSTNVKHGINGLKTLVADINLEEYLSYHGSLTHPPCQNTVTWIVFTEKISISSELLSLLRQLQDVHGRQIMRNYRGLQPLLGRRSIFRKAP